MTVKLSKYTPEEPNWEREIARQKDSCDPDFDDGELWPVVFKFCASRAEDVEAVLNRVKDANDRCGTPAANQIDRDTVQQSVNRLCRLGYVQGAIVSWVTPGVYPVWNAYRKEGARSWEYRVSVWIVVMRDSKEIMWLIGDREKTPTTMFFRRQHVVRAAHSKHICYQDEVSFGKAHYRVLTPDDPYPEWADQKATQLCQMVDYDTAEDLACTDNIDVWAGVMNNHTVSRAASDLAAQVVQRYADDRLAVIHKL
jgi:hypothetical protein